MQLIKFEDYAMVWLEFEAWKGKRTLREIVRQFGDERRRREEIWRRDPFLARAVGREDLLWDRERDPRCS